MVVQQTIGQILRALRQRKGLTQKELASKIQGEVDYSYIGKIERGEQLPSLKMLERLSNALAVPLSAFFQGFGTDMTARREGGEAGNEPSDPERERLLLYLVHTVHDDDIPLLIEMVRILNKRRKAQNARKNKRRKAQNARKGRTGRER